MRPLITTIVFLSLITSHCFSQEDTAWKPPFKTYKETAIKLLVGGNLQQAKDENQKEFTRKYLEIGIHKTITAYDWHHPSAMWTHGLSVEISSADKTIFGFKYGAWGEFWLFVLGLNVIYYTDFQKGNFKIRPELGIGAHPFKLTFGFNIPTIQNAKFKELQKSYGQITLNVLLKLKTLKREDQ